jgi:hypothetical protein
LWISLGCWGSLFCSVFCDMRSTKLVWPWPDGTVSDSQGLSCN